MFQIPKEMFYFREFLISLGDAHQESESADDLLIPTKGFTETIIMAHSADVCVIMRKSVGQRLKPVLVWGLVTSPTGNIHTVYRLSIE